MRHWLISTLIASNQFVNALTGGDPQMSVSARAAFAREHGSKVGKALCATLDHLDRHHPNPLYPEGSDHCAIAIIDYRLRKEQHQ